MCDDLQKQMARGQVRSSQAVGRHKGGPTMRSGSSQKHIHCALFKKLKDHIENIADLNREKYARYLY